ncbi:MAG: ACT domain-containing protein [Clostridiales bacterium]|jgi:ACT domain-containing protein|nr:ACT domain-containing protein [Clostridiales bacterium]
MRAVITVIGKDTTGIIARVSEVLWKHGINILDINQSVMDDLFAMVMLTDISKCSVGFTELVSTLNALGESLNLKIHTMHEDIFNSMHRI